MRLCFHTLHCRYHPDKYSGPAHEAEELQEAISEAKTVLEHYKNRFEDGFVACDNWRMWWNPYTKYVPNPLSPALPLSSLDHSFPLFA